MVNEWVNIDIPTLEPPEFTTHLNYIKFLNSIPTNLKLISNYKFISQIQFYGRLKSKASLVNLTEQSLIYEQELVHKDPQYGIICVPWVSVKAYYLLFYLLQILRYIVTGQTKSFFCSHKNMSGWFKQQLKERCLNFDFDPLNLILSLSDVLSFKSSLGSNLKGEFFDVHERFHAILKKIALYKEEDFKVTEGLDSFRTKKAQSKRAEFRNKTTINLFEFFYYYRIKANYRDLEFLESQVKPEKIVELYCHFFTLTTKFSSAFKECANKLAEQRFKQVIF